LLVDLVKTTTRDGVQLDGVYQSRGESVTTAIGVDAFCLVHGTGGNFYSSSLFSDLAERLLQLGCAVLRVNTRGHDAVSTAVTPQGGKRLGAAYEVIDDCRHDLAAWMDWLRQQVGPQIGLVGHSMGAIKALYALARETALAPVAVIAISPPRLSYRAFFASASGAQFLETYARAEELLACGQPATLMEVQLPLPYLITAAGYVEKYGPDERYNFVQFLPAVPCPTLITLGGKDVATNMAFQGLPEDLEPLATRQRSLSIDVIPNADHFYTGLRKELADRVEQWLRQLPRGVYA
jgi:pimeloyl-ACP methyl ester carboxylesterase